MIVSGLNLRSDLRSSVYLVKLLNRNACRHSVLNRRVAFLHQMSNDEPDRRSQSVLIAKKPAQNSHT